MLGVAVEELLLAFVFEPAIPGALDRPDGIPTFAAFQVRRYIEASGMPFVMVDDDISERLDCRCWSFGKPLEVIWVLSMWY